MSLNISSIVDRVWSETRPDVKEDYGQTYFELFKRYIRFYNTSMTSTKHNQVLDPLVQSITCERVFPKYLCCSAANRAIMWSLNWLPVQWVDPIVPLFTYRATPDWLNRELRD